MTAWYLIIVFYGIWNVSGVTSQTIPMESQSVCLASLQSVEKKKYDSANNIRAEAICVKMVH